ncbi:hypothetical protein [Streptosporangium sp. NPDC051022]|uniref:hypothetical protein n=1 Tax=Streptosporangium sp. NPDC051022 TaxID=3155752 RepID=UPI00341F32C3
MSTPGVAEEYEFLGIDPDLLSPRLRPQLESLRAALAAMSAIDVDSVEPLFVSPLDQRKDDD